MLVWSYIDTVWWETVEVILVELYVLRLCSSSASLTFSNFSHFFHLFQLRVSQVLDLADSPRDLDVTALPSASS